MSKKGKKEVLDSTRPYCVGGYEDAKARLKYQSLMQDYEELQQEANAMGSRLEAAKERKLMLAAEVRFLRRRYKQLVNSKNMNSALEHLVCAPSSVQQTKAMKEQLFHRKEASQCQSRLIPKPKPKKNQYTSKPLALHDSSPVTIQARKKKLYRDKEATQHGLILSSDLDHKGRIHVTKEALASNVAPVVDKNKKEKMTGTNGIALRNSIAAFDLNRDSRPNGEGALMPRAPIFDLNEVSTGDEDFQSNVEALKFEETKRCLARGINDEQQNDLKLSICRNAGEGSSRVGKRKISWQDPVALRV